MVLWGTSPYYSIVIYHHYGIPGALPGADSASVAFFCNDPVNGIYLRELHAFYHINTTNGTKIRADSTTRAALLINHGFGPGPSRFYICFFIHQEIISVLPILLSQAIAKREIIFFSLYSLRPD